MTDHSGPGPDEWLARCKTKAYESLDHGDSTRDAWKLFLSEMNKHPGTRVHPALGEGTSFDLDGVFTNAGILRLYIERVGFDVGG
ncbi:hypothetical protein [Amycolatopsis sp. RTGN1]|uniref:hypothetical protein n=1 Tax=Amycolatopsis ponsaeliensis TaxID=2992142 RepID=UPI00254CE5AF|nr:hypothetical protein [Amycolatopsis sp. RTGN1]